MLEKKFGFKEYIIAGISSLILCGIITYSCGKIIQNLERPYGQLENRIVEEIVGR